MFFYNFLIFQGPISIGNLWRNLCTKCIILEIKSPFTCGELNFNKNTKLPQYYGQDSSSGNNNKTIVCVLWCHYSCRHWPCQIILVSNLLAHFGKHWTIYPSAVGLNFTCDWCYISNSSVILMREWILTRIQISLTTLVLSFV